MQGWVCGDTVRTQLRRLFLIPGGWRPTRELVVGAAFLASVVLCSILVVRDARNDLDAAGHPFCYGQPYDGGYFGETDYLGTDDDPFGTIDDAATFLNEFAPLWALAGSLPIGDVAARDARLVAEDGTEFVRDQDLFRLRYADGGIVLYERTGDNRLEKVDDPCKPRQRTVRITDEQDLDAAELFNYFDDTEGFGTGVEPFFVYESGRTGSTQKINVFFGPDGRLIPVCDEAYSEIQPCLEERNVYFDSGLDAGINRWFEVGLWIFGFAIGLRLLIWLLGRLAARRQPAATAPGV